jgi:hypothetical protein
MRSVWFAFVAILGASLFGAFLLWRALDTSNPAEKVLALVALESSSSALSGPVGS